MKFDKLSKALKPLSLSASSILELNDSFKMTVLNLNVSNQVYNVRSAEYFRKTSASDEFFQDLMKFKYSAEAIDFIANVLVLDWELSDDDDELVEFSVESVIEMLSNGLFGQVVFSKIISHASVASNFEMKWEDDVTKNL